MRRGGDAGTRGAMGNQVAHSEPALQVPFFWLCVDLRKSKSRRENLWVKNLVFLNQNIIKKAKSGFYNSFFKNRHKIEHLNNF